MSAWLECTGCEKTRIYRPGGPKRVECACGGVYKIEGDETPEDFEEHRSTNNEEEE